MIERDPFFIWRRRSSPMDNANYMEELLEEAMENDARVFLKALFIMHDGTNFTDSFTCDDDYCTKALSDGGF